MQFRMKTADDKGNAVVGVGVNETYKFPFQVKINIGNIGGPSAGLMFALGIMDKLTPGGLTGGRFIAGTGEISANGAVSPIGGIQQKMAGARAAGATVFLTPAANCPDTGGRFRRGCASSRCPRWRARSAPSRPSSQAAASRPARRVHGAEPGGACPERPASLQKRIPMIAVDWRRMDAFRAAGTLDVAAGTPDMRETG